MFPSQSRCLMSNTMHSLPYQIFKGQADLSAALAFLVGSNPTILQGLRQQLLWTCCSFLLLAVVTPHQHPGHSSFWFLAAVSSINMSHCIRHPLPNCYPDAKCSFRPAFNLLLPANWDSPIFAFLFLVGSDPLRLRSNSGNDSGLKSCLPGSS